MNLLDYNVTSGYPLIAVKEKTVVNTINPHSYCVAKKDLVFKQALQKSDFLLPDGIGIVMAAKVLKGEKIQKIAGYDVFMNLMLQLNENHGSCFFFGCRY